jgi:predicted HTH transcriptional regulator
LVHQQTNKQTMINGDVFFNVSASANFRRAPSSTVPVYSHSIDDTLNFKPLFPTYSRMTCEDVKNEIVELQNQLRSSKFSNEVNSAYKKALSDAQTQYIKCSIKAAVSSANIDLKEAVTINQTKPNHTFIYAVAIVVAAFIIYKN